MKKIAQLLLLSGSIFAGGFDGFTSGRAGDVLHLTGSALGTLALQKTFNMEWENAGAVMLLAGFAWELADATMGNKVSFLDPAGLSLLDLGLDLAGVLISYPLRYDIKINYSHKEVAISYTLIF